MLFELIFNIGAMSCSDHFFMSLEQWVFGMGIGHLVCFVLITGTSILAFTTDIVWPLVLIGVVTLAYVMVYTIIGAIILSVSKYCFVVNYQFWILALSDIGF